MSTLDLHLRRSYTWEKELYKTHLKSLDSDSRVLRFFTNLSDSVIDRFVDDIDFDKTQLFIVEDDGVWVGVAHIYYGNEPEVAFSVLSSHRRRGIADMLMRRVIQWCSFKCINTASMVCLRQNTAIRALCKKHGIIINNSDDELMADIIFPTVNLYTVFNEHLEQYLETYNLVKSNTTNIVKVLYNM